MRDAPGFRVAVLGTDVQSRNHYIVVSVAKAFARHAGVASVRIVDYKEAVDACRVDADVLVAIGGAGAMARPLLRAIAAVRTSVLWTTEDPYEFAANQELAAHFDHVFTNDAGIAARYKSPGASHLPLAASQDIHAVGDNGSSAPLYDVFFVGTAWPNRIAVLNQLLPKLSPDLRLKFGLSNNSFLSNHALASLDMITDFRVAPQEFVALAARARVVLTLDRGFSSSGTSAATGDSPPPRVFETAMSGSPQVYLSTSSHIRDLYELDKEIVVAPTVEKAAEAIEELLANPDTARRIGLAARAKTLNRHLYDHRVASILSNISARSAKARVRSSLPTAAVNKRKRILFVSHNVAGVEPFGGVEVYQEILAKTLPEYDFLTLYPARHKPAFILKDSGGTVEYMVNDLHHNALFDHRREQIFQDILVEQRIDLVHFHHFLGGHSFAYPVIARALGVPAILTAHDYFMICSQFTLTDQNGRYCNISNPQTNICDVCLSVRGLASPGSQARRREAMASMLANVDRILHNSAYTQRKFQQIYPLLHKDKHLVIGMMSSRETLQLVGAARQRAAEQPDAKTDRATQNRRLRVVVLGNFSNVKGGRILVEMLYQMCNMNIDFFIDGRIDDEFRSVLTRNNLPNVEARGSYSGVDLKERLRDMDVSLHFSIWPETYCIALDEARAAGLVPIVLGYGALGERVHDGVDGFCIPPDRPYDLMPLLMLLADQPGVLEGMRTSFDAVNQAASAHLAAMREVYAQAIDNKPVTHSNISLTRHRRIFFSDLGMRFNNQRWDVADVVYDENPPFRLGDVITEERRCGILPLERFEKSTDAIVAAPDRSAFDKALVGLDEVVVKGGERTIIRISEKRSSLLLRAWLAVSDPNTAVDLLLTGHQSFAVTVQHCHDVKVQERALQLSVGRFDPSSLPPGIYRVVAQLRCQGGIEWLNSSLFLNIGDTAEETILPVEQPVSVRVRVSKPQHSIRTWLGQRKSSATGGIGNLDVFGKSFSAFAENTVNRNQLQSIEVRGWVLPRDKKQTLQNVTVVLVTADQIAEFDTDLVDRADVAAHFGNTALSMSGFTATIPANELPSGEFRVAISGKTSDGTAISTEVGRVTIV